MLVGESSVGASRQLTSLSNLVLSETNVSHVDELFALERKCPSLKELKLLEVPLVTDLPDNIGREIIVASLPQLSTLNGSKISEDEMEKAERVFVRHYRGCDTMSQRLQEHFDKLVTKHGLLEPFRKINLGLPEGHIALKLTWFVEEMSESEHNAPVPIGISLMATFRELKLMAAEALGLDLQLAEGLEVFYKNGDDYAWSGLPDGLEKPLYRMFIEDNGDILVKKPAVA